MFLVVNQNSPDILSMLGKITVFCILLLSIAQGGYYWSFSRPAYSLVELHAGYRKILNEFAVDHPTVSDIRSKVASPSTVQRPIKRSVPLSSLPTVSGVAYTRDAPPSETSESSSEGEL